MIFKLKFNTFIFYQICFVFYFSIIVRAFFIDPISDTISDQQAQKSFHVDEIRLNSVNNIFNSSSKQIISNSEGGAFSVYAADIDGDGDMDVLSASRSGDTVAWYENGGTFTRRFIGTANGAMSVYAADIDGDGDMDVLSANADENTIILWENDGKSTFTKRVITDTVNHPHYVYAADIDGDGDIDVLSASVNDDTIAWYENGGQSSTPTFTKRVITNTADVAFSVYATDIDGDGDMDVLSASYNDNTVAWYENGGQSSNPTFTKRVITNTANGAFSVYAVDIDGDGDMDVLSASGNDNTIAWYQNYRFSSLNCNTGKYQVVLNGSASCMNCSVGKYKSETGNYNCKSCSAGYYQDQTGQSSCKTCPINSYQDKTGQPYCSYCPIGTSNSIPGQTSASSCVLNITDIYDFKTKATNDMVEVKSDMVEVKSDIAKIKVTLEKISATLIKLRKRGRSKKTEL